jgi:protein tyrosine phosphatase (PTP) superfamily phosphohydrolase (DUF442 family)
MIIYSGFDFGDIVYFLFILVTIIASAVSQARKKKKEKTSLPSPERKKPQQTEIEDMLEELLGRKKKQAPVLQEKKTAQPVKKYSQKTEKAKSSILSPDKEGEHSLPYTSIRGNKKAFADKITDSEINSGTNSENNYVKNLMAEFDLRNAVIYSEVLNNKYL